jgi:hypothetical protein
MTYNPDSPEVTALYTAVFDAERYGQRNPRETISELLNEAYERGRLSGIVKYEPKIKEGHEPARPDFN